MSEARWERTKRPKPGQSGFSSIPGEAETAGRLEGGRRRAMSGAGKVPYDVASLEHLVDRKETHAKSHLVKREELDRLRRRALQEGRVPLYLVAFWEGEAEVVPAWAIVPFDYLLELQSRVVVAERGDGVERDGE